MSSGKFTIFVCGRRPTAEAAPPCSACGDTNGTLSCSFELGGAKRGWQCGRRLCAKCATGRPVLCPPHRKFVIAQARK